MLKRKPSVLKTELDYGQLQTLRVYTNQFSDPKIFYTKRGHLAKLPPQYYEKVKLRQNKFVSMKIRCLTRRYTLRNGTGGKTNEEW